MTALKPVAYPLTYDPATQGPAYSASDYRLTAGAGSAIPDGTPFGGLQGVRAGSPSPLITIDGTTVSVGAHMGWLCPWEGMGTYTYALPSPVQVTVRNTTGSYKIAVVLEDKAAGHGSGELVDVKVYDSSMPAAEIPGLVIGRVDSGIASDTAPILYPNASITAQSYEQLILERAVDGTCGRTADGSRYVREGGQWILTGMDEQMLVSPRRRVVEWLSDWTGTVAWPAGQSKPEFKTTLQVSSPPSLGGRWYLIEIGSRVDISKGEYGMRCTIEDKQHGTVFNNGMISPRCQGGVDNFNFTRSAWIPNGVYDVTLNLCRWGEVTIGGDRAWAYTDWSPIHGATTCYRYFHITQMS